MQPMQRADSAGHGCGWTVWANLGIEPITAGGGMPDLVRWTADPCGSLPADMDVAVYPCGKGPIEPVS